MPDVRSIPCSKCPYKAEGASPAERLAKMGEHIAKEHGMAPRDAMARATEIEEEATLASAERLFCPEHPTMNCPANRSYLMVDHVEDKHGVTREQARAYVAALKGGVTPKKIVEIKRLRVEPEKETPVPYTEKRCKRCGNPFLPNGPRQLSCDACGKVRAREYEHDRKVAARVGENHGGKRDGSGRKRRRARAKELGGHWEVPALPPNGHVDLVGEVKRLRAEIAERQARLGDLRAALDGDGERGG